VFLRLPGVNRRCLLPLLCLPALVGLASWPALAESPIPILPLSQVKPGMVGEAHTVFQGTAPEVFKVRVISILRDFMPRQDVILVRAEDPRVESVGIAAGMSGSPVYVDGKLMGAIAYGWSFAKEPLAGVTPIESMLAERDRPDRPSTDPYLARGPESMPAEAKGNRDGTASRLEPVAIPLSVSGASDAALAYLGEELHPFGLHPVRAGGSGDKPRPAANAANRLVPGAAVGVALIQGDMTTTAMGTLTYMDGKQVFAFGHPMFGIGAVNLPMVQGEIHAIIPSLASSLKMSSPVAEIGNITDDSRNGVIGVLGGRAGTVPVRVSVVSQGAKKLPFSVEIARHRRLLPLLATMAISTALAEAVPDVTDMVADVTTRLFVRGFDPILLRDQIATTEALPPRVLAMSHGMHALGELMGNPFAPAVIEKIEVNARVEFRAGGVEIVALTSPGDKVRAGARLPLRVTLRPFDGAEFSETLTIDVPPSLAGRSVKVEVAAGEKVRPELPRAEDLQGFVDNLRVYYPASSLVVSLTTRDDGAALHGRLIRNLPPSALDTLRPTSQSRRADAFHVVKRTEFQRTRVFSGQKEITIQVRDPE
jgi:hypothetical protein